MATKKSAARKSEVADVLDKPLPSNLSPAQQARALQAERARRARVPVPFDLNGSARMGAEALQAQMIGEGYALPLKDALWALKTYTQLSEMYGEGVLRSVEYFAAADRVRARVREALTLRKS